MNGNGDEVSSKDNETAKAKGDKKKKEAKDAAKKGAKKGGDDKDDEGDKEPATPMWF